MELFKVTNKYRNDTSIMDEKELRQLAQYYYHNSNIVEECDFINEESLEETIKFIERVDKVERNDL